MLAPGDSEPFPISQNSVTCPSEVRVGELGNQRELPKELNLELFKGKGTWLNHNRRVRAKLGGSSKGRRAGRGGAWAGTGNVQWGAPARNAASPGRAKVRGE